MSVRHSIMQTNYYVRIRTVEEEQLEELGMHEWKQHWCGVREMLSLPLTGLTRKVLSREGLLAKGRQKVRLAPPLAKE
jgi:A/G-specific adenine glycosylase